MKEKTLEKLIKILKAVEQAGNAGIWLTQIGKLVDMHRTTVARLIERHLTEFVTVDMVPPFNLNMVKLKPGRDLRGILRYLKVKEKIEAVRNMK
ncbi:MAG: hypothetical protein HYW23_01025 [Candidatus Aenigmarchaeota archaeon]|nr:hypothetical protein [Candidatus Aenigmarchaeota archaeon]